MFPAIYGIVSQGGFTGAYDDIPDLVHLYEIARRGLGSYTGNLVDVYRDSDGEIEGFGPGADGNLDWAAITSWAAGATIYADKAYDQKGGNHLPFTSRPLLVLGGPNNRPVLRFNGTANYGTVAFSSALSQPFSYFAVAEYDESILNNNVNMPIVDGDDSSNRAALWQRGNVSPDVFGIWAGSDVLGNRSITDYHFWSANFNGASSQFWIDGFDQGTGNAGAGNPDGITMGARFDGALAWLKGDIGVLMICDPALDASGRAAAETAINDFWGILAAGETFTKSGDNPVLT